MRLQTPSSASPPELEVVAQAIRDRKLIAFTLHGYNRIAEPHVCGWHQGVVQVLAYQVGGDSRKGGLPNWRTVRLSEVRQLTVLDEHFAPRALSIAPWDEIRASVE